MKDGQSAVALRSGDLGSDEHRSADIDTLLRGSHLAGKSSLPLGWDGLVVEQRLAPPIERQEEVLDKHYVLLWRGVPTITERRYGRGRFTRLIKRPGTLSLGGAGPLPAVRPHSPYDVIACVLDPAILSQVAEEAGSSVSNGLYEHLGVCDQALASLIELSAREAEEGGLHGKLYGDSLAYAIVARFNRLARTEGCLKPAASTLPKHRLRRVLDKIESEYDRDLGLSELARESGYSRAHFLRMFQTTTGTTPHRHLREIRLAKARELLLAGARSITEVALACGFSSHAHLTHLFRQRYGTTPSEFRRENSTQIQG
jgi:AraC family transcriptional regulator